MLSRNIFRSSRSIALYRQSGGQTFPSRGLVTSAQKRSLNKDQLEGAKGAAVTATAKPTPPSSSGGGSATKPADVPPTTGNSSGGGAIFLLAFSALGAGGAYYSGMIPDEYLPDILKSGGGLSTVVPQKKPIKAAKELKEVVEEVTHKSEQVAQVEVVEVDDSKGETIGEVAVVATNEETAATPERGVEEEEVSLEHPKDGNRVDIEKINTYYQTVNKGRAKQNLEEAQEAASKATHFNESSETRTDPTVALSNATAAMNELQSTTSLENSQTLAAARAALRSDMDEEYFKDLDQLTENELRVRVVQLATEMSDRTKWEAVRLKEFLTMKEKEVGEKYLEILQKQRLEFEALLAQKLREQEDTITRQANAALQAKEESIQNLLKATSEAKEQETRDILNSETKRIASDLEVEYQQKLQNDLAQMKERHVQELERYAASMAGLQDKLSSLESRLEVSRNYESGSKKAHRVSAAALALANKLEVGEGAAVELAALKGAAGEEGVIASAVGMIPRSAEGGVPTVADLQASFDKAYVIGRQVSVEVTRSVGIVGV